jgi:hypothetical protein
MSRPLGRLLDVAIAGALAFAGWQWVFFVLPVALHTRIKLALLILFSPTVVLAIAAVIRLLRAIDSDGRDLDAILLEPASPIAFLRPARMGRDKPVPSSPLFGGGHGSRMIAQSFLGAVYNPFLQLLGAMPFDRYLGREMKKQGIAYVCLGDGRAGPRRGGTTRVSVPLARFPEAARSLVRKAKAILIDAYDGPGLREQLALIRAEADPLRVFVLTDPGDPDDEAWYQSRKHFLEAGLQMPPRLWGSSILAFDAAWTPILLTSSASSASEYASELAKHLADPEWRNRPEYAGRTRYLKQQLG